MEMPRGKRNSGQPKPAAQELAHDSSKQQRNQREFSERIHRILYQYGWGEVTEWVIRHCPFFQRLAWGLYLEWSLTDCSPSNSEIEAAFGSKFANNLRMGQSRLRERLEEKFSEDPDKESV
jgi:hypothetical protein